MHVIELSAAEIINLAEAVTRADATGATFKVAVDGGFKYKVGGGMWTPPLGTPGI